MAYPQATPMRPVPGAFMHTPAVASRFGTNADPVRRRLFEEGSNHPVAGPRPGFGDRGFDAPTGPQQQALQPMGQPVGGTVGAQALTAAAAQPLPPLAKAASYVNNSLAMDGQYPELDQYCKQMSSDYQRVSDSSLAPFKTVQTYTLPDRVFEQYERAEVSTSMGLFAELNHAWVTVDNCLYLWDYTHPNPELIGYEDNEHSITSVKLVAPKPGVFVKDINYMLVVATSADMFLLGVAAQSSANGATSVTLYQTRMQFSLRGTEAHVIAGAANGRIFFAGSTDSDIYELYYQQEEKWFSSRTGKINHSATGWSSVVPLAKGPQALLWGSKTTEYIVDIVIDNTRNLLYSLSNTSTIRTYHMEGPDKLTKVIEKTKHDCLRDIMHALSGNSPLLNDQTTIVSICPVTSNEDVKVHLIAVTNTGCRLFMSAAGASYYMTSPNQIPQSMQLHSIKFPPSNLSRSQRQGRDAFGAPSDFDTQSNALITTNQGARFAPGYFLASVKKDGGARDILFASAPDTGRIKNSAHQGLRFYEQSMWIDVGGKPEAIGLVSKPFAATSSPTGFGNELAVQFDQSNSEFAVLTNTGIHIIRRRRLVDIFAAAIRNAAGDDGLNDVYNTFANNYGRVETVTAALAVACGQGSDQQGGTGRGALDQSTEDRARQIFVNNGGNPTLPEQDGQQPTVESVKPSSRHGALALYLSRLIRSVWNARVISIGSDAVNGLVVDSTIALGRLRTVQEHLERLKSFLEANKSFIQGLSGPADLQRAGNKQEQIAFQGEHQAMYALLVLMSGISEGISFVQMLFDERVADIYARLDETAKQQLRDLTYERLFSQESGKDLAKLLVKAIVNRNIESGSNVETVADALRRRCGSFCSPDDVVIFRAQEQVKRASDPTQNPNTARNLLGESLKLFQRVAGSLTQTNLETAVEQYLGMRYYAGAIQLCLTVAQEKDRGNAAQSWFKEGKAAGDPRIVKFEERKRCYNLIHHVLQSLDAASSKEPEMIDGKLTSTAIKRNEAYDVVNSSADEVFHNDLYEWYVEQGWTDRLLRIESPHVVDFLQNLATSNVAHADLLCRYFTMRNLYYQAAKVQADLAQSDFTISIKDRLQLLSRAKTNVSVMTNGIGRQELQLLNHEVTELLEVAHIQDDLLERLRVDTRIPAERLPEIEKSLDGQIQGLTELFNNFADQAGYYDLCLLIYHAADFRNPTTIAQTWSNLIQQTHDENQQDWDQYEGSLNRNNQEAPPQPCEKLVGVIQEVCHRASNDSFIFPVPTLMPELCRYALENAQDNRIGADPNWPVILFLQLGVSHDLLARILETMFEGQDVPFRGAGRLRVVEWVTYAVHDWARQVVRAGRPERALEPWVSELMADCETLAQNPPRAQNEGGLPPQDLLREVREVKKTVDGFSGLGMGSFRGSMGFL
ncbi:putative Non-repetitive/WGA-negative nucleoporin C-terminal-domain-containing protein [Seiridium cardinale]|uniref:Non-repetitive/WGA-negative nucleoporin C-terminal-domain-containing protein n=1 Tax=Seiridium cardinale TaxID=138064 RepID=A0ABR2XT29_9PEZI